MSAGTILLHAFFLSTFVLRSCQVDNRGKEFLVSFLPQHPHLPHSGTNRLYISSFEDTRVRLQAPFLALDKWYRVTSGGMRIITLPGSARADSFTGNEKKGIRITSEKPVSLQGLQVLQYSGEGFLGLPIDLLGTDYMVPTYPPVISAIAQVVAGEDNTTVSFHLRLPPGGRVQHDDTHYVDGGYINETLNKLEVFHVLADSDLSGTRITSSKPVAVFSGNDCAMVPSKPCNQLVEQIPPISSWGTQFITSPVLNNQAGSTFHVLASEANTRVYVDSHSKTVLSPGETYEIDSPSNQSLVIHTTNPSLVVHYHKGVLPSKSPFMALVPPTAWFSNDYTIYVPLDENGKAFDSYVNVIIDTRERDELRVKGNLAPQFTWEQISGSGYSRTALHLFQTGIYHIYHKNPSTNFSCLLHGEAVLKWFAFPAGMKLVRGDPSCSPTSTVGGDERDNDCDGRTDEELANGKDDDADGSVDEDLATPVPDFLIPKDIVDTPLVSCDSSSNVADVSNTGFARGSPKGVCKLRGNWTISFKDNVGNFEDCIQEFDRVWTMRDACQNVITKTQRMQIRRTEVPRIQFPAKVTMTCRETKYLQPSFTGEVRLSADSCPRRAKTSFQDKLSDCKNSEGRLTRTWIVVDECKKKTLAVQIINLLPTGTRKTTNYVVLFKITNEQYSDDLKDSSSPVFKRLADNLDHEMKEKFYSSAFGRLFVAAHVIHFSNYSSVVASMIVKMDALAQVDQKQLADFLNRSLQNGTLGNYQVDPSSVRVEDFDECRGPNLNDCHEKAICTNIPGSFKCTCREGYSGNGTVCQTPPSIFHYDAALQVGTEENVTLRCHARGVPAPDFTWMTPQGIVNGTLWIYEKEYLDDGSFKTRGKILQDDGSLLVFNTRVHDKGSYKCVAVNVMGKDERTVNLTVSRDIVEVDVAITIEDRVFDKDLENKSSARYQAMEKEVKEELTLLFQDTEGFERIEILGFTNGSVKVRFRVIVKVDKAKDKNPKVIATKVGKTLQVSVKNGRVGSLQVAPAVELNEIPPPPVNVQASDIQQTEAAITWSHPELHEMFAINSYLLQFKKFGTSTWRTFAAAKGETHRLQSLDQGTAYIVRLKSKNELGVGEPSENLELRTLKEKSSTGLVLGIVISLIVLIILAIAGFFLYRRWRNKRKRRHYQTADEALPMNPTTTGQTRPQSGSVRYAPVPGIGQDGTNVIKIEASFTWREIPRDRVTLGKILGEGEFGMVVKGELTEDDGSKLPCAVKKLKRTATESDLKDLLNELEIMTAVGKHPNLVNLIGACSIGGPLMMVVEFAEHGNLLHHLRERRKQNYEDMNEYNLEISSSERLRIACDVSEGMKHLAKIKCAHRDLAARNVLLGEGMVAKVSDFGLSRDIYTDNVYEKKSGGKLPAKWMAMESLEFGINTSQSDVWSFGVLLWEIETGGCAPYAGMVLNELLSKLKEGKRLEKPRYCSDWLYALMRRCWNPNPNERPTFEEISDELHRMLKLETDYLTAEEYRLEPVYANDTFENVSLA